MEDALDSGAVARLLAAYSSLARRRALSCITVFFLTIGLRVALLPWLPIPNPIIHDEFSYLLAADTYAHGRLANSTPPFWQHFETFQEIQQPTRASKYQVLQGMALAAGQKLFRFPWIGVVLTAALMCAALCWMLQGWISPEWALLGALLFTLRVGVLSYWMNSFEGGAVPAIGGALALGAAGRIWRSRQPWLAVVWALGLAVLMHSRPYDAAVLGVVSAAALAWLWRKSGASCGAALTRIALPASAVFAISLAALLYVDLRVTGRPLTLPYQVNTRQYEVAPMFVFLPLLPEPVYDHPVMRDFYTGWPVQLWKDSRREPLVQFLGRIYTILGFFFGAWPLAVLLFFWRGPRAVSRISLTLLAAAVLSLAPLSGVAPHYAAAFAGAFYLPFLEGLSGLASWRGSTGKAAAVAVVVLFVLCGRDSFSQALAQRSADFGQARADLQSRLDALPGKQLVLVRYAPGHNDQNEWVFNPADIEGSKVVWAREMSPAQDRPFLEYFPDRQVWLVQADQTPPLLAPYAAPTEPPAESAKVSLR